MGPCCCKNTFSHPEKNLSRKNNGEGGEYDGIVGNPDDLSHTGKQPKFIKPVSRIKPKVAQ